jgi:hypothetical protein
MTDFTFNYFVPHQIQSEQPTLTVKLQFEYRTHFNYRPITQIVHYIQDIWLIPLIQVIDPTGLYNFDIDVFVSDY